MTAPHPSADPGAVALSDALRLAFRALRFALMLGILAYAASGIFIVNQHERAIVLHFGRASGLGADRTKGPGLHWTWPRPISEIIRIPTERVQTLSSRRFWYARPAAFQDDPEPTASLRPDLDGYVLTGDANLLHTRWAVRFSIALPFTYQFEHAQPEETLLDELDRAVVRASAQLPIDRALRTDLAHFRERVEAELRDRVAALQLGVRIHGVDLLGIAPPTAVAAAFDQVTQSAQERDQRVSDARAYAIRTRNEALAESDRRLAEGAAARQQRVSAVAARADAFTSLRAAWQKHPDLVEQTLRQDALREVLAKAGRKIVVTDAAPGQQLRLNFGAPPAWTPEAEE